ncbi:MAG: hypothetical protein H7A48_14575 [Akkermansiaceae bacterium]|nr:hypothetical protein [Akkermansiaceae bacterium]
MSASLSATACASELGISRRSLLRRYREGRFKAEIDDGRLLRFDPEKVRKALRKNPRPLKEEKLPAGMVPVIPTHPGLMK